MKKHPYTGPDQQEAELLLKTHGYNELPSAAPKKIWRIAFEVMKEPMFLLLITCGLLYILLGDITEGVVLLSTIFIIIFITFYQYQKTEKALEALKKLSSPRALVIRAGEEIRIPGREVVRGDVLVLREGDRIPADADVLYSESLVVDESLLTGESLPVTKHADQKMTENEQKVFSGTLVIQGWGYARVRETGAETHFGRIGRSLASVEQNETRLQKEMKVLIRNLFIIGLALSLIVMAAFYITRGNFIQSVLNGIASAMAILPEEFPVVLTVFLALGAWRLSKQNVLTRQPSAIETLGSATVLCSDKTGTITQNKMAVAAVYVNPQLGHTSAGISDQELTNKILYTASLASQTDPVDPMEKALHEAILQYSNEKNSPTLLKEFAFSKQLLAMTRVYKTSTEEILLASKGAPEAIFQLCRLSQDQISFNKNEQERLAAQGYRVIAVAGKSQFKNNLPQEQNELELEFYGLIALADPVRPEVEQAVKECYSAGIKVMMITGDFPATAQSIGRQIGLSQQGRVITGAEMNEMTDAELSEIIGQVSIFARVIPEQKLRIVNVLKARGEIVAMTGDGVNDAPALKAADIGVAMGNKGTDVAREASSLVLLDDNFASIVNAIRSGRRIYDNLQKAMSYILSIHIPIIGLALVPAFYSEIPIILMPLHIVLMELLIDPACSIAFEYEQEERMIMNRSPRSSADKFFGSRSILKSVFYGLILFGMVLFIYFLSVSEGHTAGEVRAITFSALIIGNIAMIYTNLSKSRSFIQVITERNLAAIIISLIAMVLLWCAVYLAPFQDLFGFENPGYFHFIPSIIGAGSMLALFELIKLFNLRHKVKE